MTFAPKEKKNDRHCISIQRAESALFDGIRIEGAYS